MIYNKDILYLGNEMNYRKILPMFTGAIIAGSAFQGCKKPESSSRVLFTSNGEELRVAYDIEDTKSDNPFGAQKTEAVLGGQTECGTDELLYNGHCLDTQLFHIWSNGDVSTVNDRSSNSCETQGGCEALSGYSETATFKAVVGGPDAVLNELYPVYSLSKGASQVLTSSSTEKKYLIDEQSYQDSGVLFYVAGGNSGSQVKLSRYVDLSNQNVIYQLGFKSLEGYRFDGSIGGVLKQ